MGKARRWCQADSQAFCAILLTLWLTHSFSSSMGKARRWCQADSQAFCPILLTLRLTLQIDLSGLLSDPADPQADPPD